MKRMKEWKKPQVLGSSLLLLGVLWVLMMAPASVCAAGGPAANEGVFVSAAQLKDLLREHRVKVIDVRSSAEYEKGHIAGAISIPWHLIQVPERDGLRNKWAEDQVLEKVFAQAGLSYNDDLVLCDKGTLNAGIPFLIFTYAGFGKLHVLEGGIGAWDGGADSVHAKTAPSQFTLSRKNGGCVVDKDYVAGKISSPTAVIVEGRLRQAYEDGHIPTAAHLDPATHLKEGKFLKPRDVISLELANKGITPEKEIVLYCGSGGAAARNFLVLKELGFKKVAVYLNAWDEWSIDTTKVQELGVPNFTFSGSALNAKNSLGPRFLTQAELKSALDQKSALVLDVRSAPDFRLGSIPGSVNVYWNDTLDANRNPKSGDELTALFSKAGVTPDKHIVIFTRGGFQATYMHTLLKLTGYPQVSVYTGPWTGWHLSSWKAVLGK